jgi:hypothetical protein
MGSVVFVLGVRDLGEDRPDQWVPRASDSSRNESHRIGYRHAGPQGQPQLTRVKRGRAVSQAEEV